MENLTGNTWVDKEELVQDLIETAEIDEDVEGFASPEDDGYSEEITMDSFFAEEEEEDEVSGLIADDSDEDGGDGYPLPPDVDYSEDAETAFTEVAGGSEDDTVEQEGTGVSDSVEDQLVEPEIEEDNSQEQNRLEEIKRKAEEFKEQMDSPDVMSTISFAMLNNEGDYIEPRHKGTMRIAMLNIENDIKKTRRVRSSPQDLFSLQEQIQKFGQLQPVHVVEFGEYYLLLKGYRRLQACVNIGQTEILAYIDGTIPVEMVKYYEAILNGSSPYTFTEKINYGKFFKETQPNVGYDTIEGILGLRTGEFLKSLYIDTMKPDFQEVYQQVEKNKLTIEQGFKKIEKEIEKQEKEQMTPEEELNSGALDDQLRSTNDLTDMQLDINQQELGNRKILDPVLRRSVESRDGGYCQCCGFGKGEPDFMGAFNVHHMVAVQYGGTDKQSNLILLCNNCHTLVHDYESGRFLPEDATYKRLSSVKRIVVLGNVLVTMRRRALAELRRKHADVGRQVDAGKLTIGQALQKQAVQLNGEDYFNGSPYQTFIDSTKDLEYGGGVRGELGELSWAEEEEERVDMGAEAESEEGK